MAWPAINKGILHLSLDCWEWGRPGWRSGSTDIENPDWLIAAFSRVVLRTPSSLHSLSIVSYFHPYQDDSGSLESQAEALKHLARDLDLNSNTRHSLSKFQMNFTKFICRTRYGICISRHPWFSTVSVGNREVVRRPLCRHWLFGKSIKVFCSAMPQSWLHWIYRHPAPALYLLSYVAVCISHLKAIDNI
jgi:hypothetical protein